MNFVMNKLWIKTDYIVKTEQLNVMLGYVQM